MTDCIENALRAKQARVGLATTKRVLASRELDVVLTHEIGEIAFHALRDHYVDVYAAPEGTVGDALAAFAGHELPSLAEPTHASEAAGAPGSGSQRGPFGPFADAPVPQKMFGLPRASHSLDLRRLLPTAH